MRLQYSGIRHDRRAYRCSVTLLLACALAPITGAHESIIRQGPESAGAPEALDLFGSVLCTGDFNGDGYEDLATAAPYEDLAGYPGNDHGVVIINWGSDVGLTHVGAQTVLPTVVEHALLFGFSMASADFDGDGFDDLVVGMPFADQNGASDSGAIAVYRGGVLGFVNNPVIYNTTPLGGFLEAGDRFGFSMDAGDFDADGNPDLVVGSPGEDNDAGAVFFVFGTALGLSPVGAYWSKQSTYGGTNLPGDQFGFSVAIGNFTGFDPLPPSINPQDVAVGAPGKDFSGIFAVGNMGMVTIFTSTNSGPSVALATEYTPINLVLSGATDWGRRFGLSLAVGDFDHDGYDDLAVGRPGSSTYAGEVVMMTGSGLGLVYGNSHTAGNFGVGPAPGDLFAKSLASGDFDSDGFKDLLVGSPGYSKFNLFPSMGRVYLYRSNTALGLGPWSDFDQSELSVDNTAFDELGQSVAFGKFDDTGRANMVAGAPGAEGTAGRVHVMAPWRQPGPLECRNSIVFDCNDRIIFSQKPFDPVYTASSAKTMTILIAAERSQLPTNHPDYVSLSAVYKIPAWVSDQIGGSQFDVIEGELTTLRSLMDMTMSVSGNDAAYAIADLLTGSNAVFVDYYNAVPAFINEMNARAVQLGMVDTNFTTPNGFSGATTESTAYDMALLGRAAMQNELFESVVNNTSWQIPRSVPTTGGGYYSFIHNVGGGFVAALQSWLSQATGSKDGGTPLAGITGVFAAREEFYPWGTAVGSSFNTPAAAGWVIPNAAALLALGLNRCSNGNVVVLPNPGSKPDEMPNVATGLLNMYTASFFPPDPIHKQGLLELYNQVQDGLLTEVELVVERVSTATIPDLQTASYATDGVSGHDGITLVNEGTKAASVGVDTNTVGDPFFGLFLMPGDSSVIPAAALPAGVSSFQMSVSVSSAASTSLRITEHYSEDQVMGAGVVAPPKVSMVFHRINPSMVIPARVNVSLIGQDADPGHLVSLVLRGPDAGYTLDPCPAQTGPYGTGWKGRYGVPTLTTDVPPVLGSTVTYRFGNSLLADTTAFLALGFQPTAAPTTNGGSLNVIPAAFVALPMPAAGFEFVLPVPMDPGLCGVAIYYQLFVLDSYATNGVSFSRGLRIVFGN